MRFRIALINKNSRTYISLNEGMRKEMIQEVGLKSEE